MKTAELTFQADAAFGDRDRKLPASWYLKRFEMLRWAMIPKESIGSFRRGGGSWYVVAGQILQIHREPGFGEILQGRVTVGHVGRTSMRFDHTLRDQEGGLVASGWVTAVNLDPEGRPTPVPDSVRGIADPADLPPPAPPWPNAPAPEATHKLRTRYSDEDLLRHVNQSRYADYVADTLRALDREPYPNTYAFDYQKEVHGNTDLTFAVAGREPTALTALSGAGHHFRALLWSTK